MGVGTIPRSLQKRILARLRELDPATYVGTRVVKGEPYVVVSLAAICTLVAELAPKALRSDVAYQPRKEPRQ